MKILIKVTKEIYEKTMYCRGEISYAMRGCAIAYAVGDIAPYATVAFCFITWDKDRKHKTAYPEIAKSMIALFDDTEPEDRPSLPPFSFEVDFPDELIEEIGIGQVYKILSESKTLELVSI